MSTLESRNFEDGQTIQPVRLAADVSSSPDSSHEKNISRNGSKFFDDLASSEPVSARALSNRLPFSKSQNPIDGGEIQSEGSCRCFSLDEVLIATNNFDDALAIGIGGFGKVYKGFIDDSATMVAIKRLNTESKQGAKEFWMEVKMLSKLRHANLVALIGYCHECQEMILVYEYIVLGTLADHLYRPNTTKRNTSFSPLSWEERLDICIGAARGLGHLHSGTNQSFIHRDVKTTNILIDENWVAKISDFGLSKGTTSHSITHISTQVKGTFGYFDPEYFITQQLTTKSDVYAFGVVLLEVLCGRPAVDSKLSEEQRSLAHFAQECIKDGKLARVIDPSLSGQITPRCLKSFVAVANNCLQQSPKSRPTMAEVLGSLELALVFQQRGRTEGMTKPFQSMMDRLLKEMKNISSSSGQLKDLLSSSEDPEIHFKYIKAAVKAGQIEEVERMTRESNFYNPEKTKNFLMKAKLRNAQPLMNVCDRFGFVPELAHYLYSNNMLCYIEGHDAQVEVERGKLDDDMLVEAAEKGLFYRKMIGVLPETGATGGVLCAPGQRRVTQLLDDKCPEDLIKGLILPVRSLVTIEPLVEEFEKRNRLGLLTQFLEHLANEGSQDVHVHNALGKIVIDSNNNPEHFLTTNPYYDSRVVGKYCEEQDPTLAVVAYRRGQCDNALINVTKKNALFELQARYVVERMDGDLWAMVLNPENEFRRQLIDQVVSTEGKSQAQVSAAARAFTAADLRHELIELLKKFVLQNSALIGRFNLQNLRTMVAIKALEAQNRNFEEGKIIQPLRLAANVATGTDSSHGNNLSRNATKLSEAFPSSDPALPGASSNLLPISKSQHRIDAGVVQSEGSGHCFPLEEVLIATNNFDDALVIGIGGFGPTSHSIAHISTEVKGTFGYLDPDYYRTQRLTAKSDVYAFGVVLLEVLCGRPALDRKLSEEQMNLAHWAQQCIKEGKLARVIDPSLSGQIAPRCLKSFVVLAKNCLNESPRSRPTMAEVLGKLEFVLLSQQRGRTEGIMTNVFQSMIRLGKSNDSPRKSDSKTGAQLYHQFSLADIHEATKDFSKSLLVRNSDKVYKGSVNIDGKALVVAIIRFKKLEGVGDEIHPKRLLLHPNILSPIGFCTEGDELILVYDYMANGSLQDHLHYTDSPLSWEMRLQICFGAAQGLEYLHANGELELIHRCIEPSSILLDENWVAKVMLSNIRTTTSTCTGLLRSTTMPYNSRYQEDYLYSFGVTLLEVLICNKRWGSFFDERKQSGVYWNLNYPDMPLKFYLDDVILSDTIYHLMDPHLAGKIGSECLREFLKITWSCLLQGFRSRTSINYVVRSLHSAVHLQENWQSLNASTAARTQSSSNEVISVNVYQEARNLSPEYDWTEGPFGPIFTLW
ncbi:hypothetical protein RHGRI_003922 [Rhododendron griersonianum]|uniref:Protein kinase domain-containing protein n=1 Tax=Rhododendron griersonianum TaxID=479676 RepID=A0AAV6L6Q1_9ERIC|nr:hypothetical protein RHGRI_003922 [Rhododendron griersonianum]